MTETQIFSKNKYLNLVIRSVLPVAIISLAAWVWNTNTTISELRAKFDQDKIQWQVIQSQNDKIDVLEVDIKVMSKIMDLGYVPKKEKVVEMEDIKTKIKEIKSKPKHVDSFIQQQRVRHFNEAAPK